YDLSNTLVTRLLILSIPLFIITLLLCSLSSYFFFNDTAPTEIYTLSLHDALPILLAEISGKPACLQLQFRWNSRRREQRALMNRSEEHTSELQSHLNLVCRLLLEKKNKLQYIPIGLYII